VADAHAAIGRLHRPSGGPALRAVVNQAGSAAEAAEVLARLAATSRQFLGIVVTPLGYVRGDPRVGLAVRKRRPFVVEFPGSIAARGVRRLARTLIEERAPRPRRPGFFAALAARRALTRVSR
jgi:flagellar biosynthesis protein FlhG